MLRDILKVLLFIIMCIFSTQAIAATTLTYQYDANGNQVSGDGKYYEYNDANQLVKVRQGDASGPVLAQYFYDYTGQRIKKVENGVTTYYIGKHYETRVEGGVETNTSYYFANGERVAKKDPSGNMYYYLSDHLGGTNAILDASGNLVERTTYYPYGEIREGGTEKYTYTGKEKDKVTDSYYFEARYYNPAYKHFTQADTVAPDLYDPQDLNRYAYARNNPLRFIDPSGHKWEDRIKNNSSLSYFAKIYYMYGGGDLAESLGRRKSFDDWAKDIGIGKPRYDSPYHHHLPGSNKTYEADISGQLGSIVSAFHGGKVIDIDYNNAFGNFVIIEDSRGNKHKYAHLQKVLVKEDYEVDANEPIGKMGNTGTVLKNNGKAPTPKEREAGSGTHLHYEVRDKNNKLVAPY